MGLLIDSQFLIDISCDSMHISCQKCCHADWDCNSLTYILSVVMTTSEGNIGLHVDNDGEVEDDEADHQMLVDS